MADVFLNLANFVQRTFLMSDNHLKVNSEKMDQFWANILYVPEFFWAESLQKTCLYVHEKLQRNPSEGSCLKFFTFLPYGFDYLGFLTNARRGAMRSKTQWVFYRDLD